MKSRLTGTQLLAWCGPDVIVSACAGEADATRSQLRAIPEADRVYCTVLNLDKRCQTQTPKRRGGKKVPETTVKPCSVLGEDPVSGAGDRMGFTWRPSRRCLRT